MYPCLVTCKADSHSPDGPRSGIAVMMLYGRAIERMPTMLTHKEQVDILHNKYSLNAAEANETAKSLRSDFAFNRQEFYRVYRTKETFTEYLDMLEKLGEQ